MSKEISVGTGVELGVETATEMMKEFEQAVHTMNKVGLGDDVYVLEVAIGVLNEFRERLVEKFEIRSSAIASLN